MRAGDLVRIVDRQHDYHGCFGRVVTPGEGDDWRLDGDLAVRLDAGSIVRVPAGSLKLMRSAP
jgi:hypothetical protein